MIIVAEDYYFVDIPSGEDLKYFISNYSSGVIIEVVTNLY
jgi:hypothetical protein